MAGETDKLTIEIGANVQGAVSGLGKVRMALDATFSGVGSILSAWAKIDKAVYLGLSGMNAAVTKFTRSVLAVGGGFEAQMNSVAVITQATGSELEALTAKAREMGETLPITAADAASAMTIMAQRGTSVKDILSSVVDVSNLAISQGVSMAEAAELLGSTLTNFKMGVDEASRVTDMFNNASNQSALNMSKLSEAMKFVGSIAPAMGMSLEEVLAAMEALANAGLPGEMIGTGLRGVLQKLASSSEILGVKTRDATGGMRSLADVMKDLGDAGMGVPEATRIFGARGAMAAATLASASDTLETNKERLQQWGRTADAVSEKLGTWRNVVAAFASAQEGVRLEIFDQIKDGAKDGLGVLTEMTRSLREWIGETQVAQGAMQGFMKGLGLDIDVSGGFRAFLEGIDTQKIADMGKVIGQSFAQIGKAFSTLAGLVGPLVSLISRHMDTFVRFAFWDFVLGKAVKVGKGLFDIGKGIHDFAGKAKTLYDAAAPLAKIGFGKFIASVKEIGMIGTAWAGIKGAFSGLASMFASTFPTLVAQLQAYKIAMDAAFAVGGWTSALGALNTFLVGTTGTVAALAVPLGAFAYAAWDCVKAAKELLAAKLQEIEVGLTEQDAKEYAERIKHIKTGFENIEDIANDFNSKAAKDRFIERATAIKDDNIEKLKAAMEAYNASLDEGLKGFAADEEEVMSFAETILKAAAGSE
ncbi:MAG: phage tail tape measure protein, partial [Synergistaceae bacterium]|nr:phage tail tape measure protein [Synergistaceae bacterium]